MAATKKIQLTKNDSGFDLVFVVKDSKGVVIDLTGATIKFQLATLEYVNKIEGDCVITDAVNGECKYTFLVNDLNLFPAQYKASLEVTIGTKIVSTTQFIVEIIAECG